MADLGAGSGFYTFASAKITGNNGRVYAIDVDKDLLEKIKSEAKHSGLSNIDVILGDAEQLGGTKLGDGVLDRTIVSNILFQAEDKKSLAGEVYRILKKDGRVLVIDWTDSFRGMGPQSKDVVSEKTAREIFEKEGFSFEKTIDAGAHHYGIIFRK